MSDVVTRAETFIAKPVHSSLEWRSEAQDTIRDLIQEVAHLKSVIMDGAVAAHLKEHPTRKGDGPW